jgi:predicted ATPase
VIRPGAEEYQNPAGAGAAVGRLPVLCSCDSVAILGYAGAQILAFDDGQVPEVEYEDTTSFTCHARVREQP